jgi:UDP-N-acetylmuramoyl-L-alanyl-D-glutamate--2,6-diaminopimelate ligase
MEAHHFPNGLTAYVDYAHTPEEITKALETLRPLCRGRLAILFGCGGDRDRGKRPEMARAASAADLVWVTSDNPRTENPDSIIADILPGLSADTLFRTVPDRGAAIADAVSALGADDILLIAGKGHEAYQEINGVKHPFSDSGELRKLGEQRQ